MGSLKCVQLLLNFLNNFCLEYILVWTLIRFAPGKKYVRRRMLKIRNQFVESQSFRLTNYQKESFKIVER